uniref:Membrane-associated protein n=1 Tax=Steinernema glaseri TaxID=37863 RepID=A0A1I7YWL6_9BILA
MDTVPVVFIESVLQSLGDILPTQIPYAWAQLGEAYLRKRGSLVLTYAPSDLQNYALPWTFHYKLRGFDHLKERTLTREVIQRIARSITMQMADWELITFRFRNFISLARASSQGLTFSWLFDSAFHLFSPRGSRDFQRHSLVMASPSRLVLLLALLGSAVAAALLSERPFVHQKKTFPEERFPKLNELQYQALLQHIASRSNEPSYFCVGDQHKRRKLSSYRNPPIAIPGIHTRS